MHFFPRAFCLLALAPLLGSCEYYDSHEARRAQTELVGLSQDELHLCAGLPTHTETRGTSTYDTYEQSFSGASGFSASLPLVGGINFAGSGYCHATFKIVDGKVSEVDYAGDTGDLLGHVSNCSSLVDHCLDNESEAKGHPAETAKP
jgi:hypothetical protein